MNKEALLAPVKSADGMGQVPVEQLHWMIEK